MQTATIKINGMICIGCVNSIKNVLEKNPGVKSAEISLEQAQAVIQYDASQINLTQFERIIVDAGFDVIR